MERLAAEFQVSPRTILQDIRVIDAWPDPAPPRKQARGLDPRFAWAREHRRRPRTITARVRVRLAPEILARIRARGEPQEVIRRAIEAYLDTESAHTSHDCALVLLRACDPDTQDALVTTAAALKRPLAEVLASLLVTATRTAQEPPSVTPHATNGRGNGRSLHSL